MWVGSTVLGFALLALAMQPNYTAWSFTLQALCAGAQAELRYMSCFKLLQEIAWDLHGGD